MLKRNSIICLYQMFSLTQLGQLRRETLCCESSNSEGSEIKMTRCNDFVPKSQKWSHTKSGIILNEGSGEV